MPCVLTASCPLCASGRPWIEPIASCSRCLSYLLPCPALPTIMDCVSSTSPSKPVFPSLAFQVFAHTDKESMNSLDSLHSQLAPSLPPFFLCCLSFVYMWRPKVTFRRFPSGNHTPYFVKDKISLWDLRLANWSRLANKPHASTCLHCPRSGNYQLPPAIVFYVDFHACTESTLLAKLSPSQHHVLFL